MSQSSKPEWSRSSQPAQRGAAARVSRRELLKLMGVTAGTAALAAGTSHPALQPSAAAMPAIRRQTDELVVAFSADPGHLDPRVEAGGIGWSIFYHMFDSMVWRDVNANPIPYLVERWEQISPDTLRWHLRRGVRFHNGEDFNAEAVKFTIEQYTAPESRSPSKSQLVVVTDFKLHDAYTIDLITEKPNRPLLRNSTLAMAMSPRALHELGDRFATNPVGTGPMRLVEYAPGLHILMERNPDYWGKPTAFQRLRIRFIPENGTRVASLEAGEVMMVNNVPPDQLRRLRDNPSLQVQVAPTNRVMFVTLRTDRPPFDDKRVRQALNYAIDKEAIAQGLMDGMAPIVRAPLPEGILGFHPNLPPYQYDPARARQLLAEAGATGATFNFGAPNGRYLLDRQIGEAIAGFLEEVGLKVAFENPAWSTFVTEVTKFEQAKYDGYFFGWGVITGEPDQLVREHFYSPNTRRSLYRNPEVDRLIETATENFDESRVTAAYQRAQELIWDDAPWIFLYGQPDVSANSRRLKWSSGRRDEFWLFHEASLES